MAQGYMADLVAVFGYPVAENPTCVMQEAAFAAGGLHWKYLTIEVKPHDLPAAVQGARAMGFKGFNCTIPHKVAVIPLLDRISPDAAMIGAVNTVRMVGDDWVGENTDGKGFLRGVREEAKIDPKGKRVIILGAGGAARAIAVELALAGAAELIIYNRSKDRGTAMVNDLISRTKARATFHHWHIKQKASAVYADPRNPPDLTPQAIFEYNASTSKWYLKNLGLTSIKYTNSAEPSGPEKSCPMNASLALQDGMEMQLGPAPGHFRALIQLRKVV